MADEESFYRWFQFESIKKLSNYDNDESTMKVYIKQYIYGFTLLENNLDNFTNKCNQSKCSHICIPIGSSYRCVCPSNYELQDQVNCIIKSDFQLDHLENSSMKDDIAYLKFLSYMVILNSVFNIILFTAISCSIIM